MNRYKRDWLFYKGRIRKVNLYKNDKGEVFISWEGDFERVYRRKGLGDTYLWAFEDIHESGGYRTIVLKGENK